MNTWTGNNFKGATDRLLLCGYENEMNTIHFQQCKGLFTLSNEGMLLQGTSPLKVFFLNIDLALFFKYLSVPEATIFAASVKKETYFF